MATYGLQTDGTWLRKPLDAIRETLIDAAVDEMGADVDLSDASSLNRFINTVALEMSLKEQIIEIAYNQGFLDTADGESLDRVIRTHFGLDRLPPVKAGVALTFGRATAAASDILIPANTIVADADGVRFTTEVAATLLTGNTSVQVQANAQIAGLDGNVAAGTITRIITPIAGIQTVTNAAPASGGFGGESDSDYRERAELSGAGRGKATRDAIRAAILAVSGVEQARVEENDSDVTVDSVPAGSIHAIIKHTGADDDEIAQAILDSKAAGVNDYGTTGSGTAVDTTGEEVTIEWDTPTEILIYVDVISTGGQDEDIEKAILAYIGGADDEGNPNPGLDIGEDVDFYKVIQAIYNVPGVIEADADIGTVADPTTNGGKVDIAIADDELARTTQTIIRVNAEVV